GDVVADGRGDDPDADAADPGAPAQVEVVAQRRVAQVEAAQGGQDLAAQQHARGGDVEDVPVAVVLALVELGGLQPGLGAAQPVDGHADFLPQVVVAPLPQPGADDAQLRVLDQRLHQPRDRIGGEHEVVV